MNQNAALMIRWCLIIFLEFTFTISIVSCGSPYPESDGVYVYRLETGQSALSKKMTLLK